MNIKIQLLNKPQLEIVKHYFIVSINDNIDSIDFIDYYNALNICKKFQDVIFTRTIKPAAKEIKFSLELNQFFTFAKIASMFNEKKEPYATLLFSDIILSGQKQTQQIEHQHYIAQLKNNEIF